MNTEKLKLCRDDIEDIIASIEYGTLLGPTTRERIVGLAKCRGHKKKHIKEVMKEYFEDYWCWFD